jgi:hypothetical protein
VDDRTEHEAELFTRYEARIVRLELRVDDLEDFKKRYAPIVDTLRDEQLVGIALAAKAELARRGVLPRWQVTIAIMALFVPPVVTAALTLLIVKH